MSMDHADAATVLALAAVLLLALLIGAVTPALAPVAINRLQSMIGGKSA